MPKRAHVSVCGCVCMQAKKRVAEARSAIAGTFPQQSAELMCLSVSVCACRYRGEVQRLANVYINTYIMLLLIPFLNNLQGYVSTPCG